MHTLAHIYIPSSLPKEKLYKFKNWNYSGMISE